MCVVTKCVAVIDRSTGGVSGNGSIFASVCFALRLSTNKWGA